jgi:hypothetical protein
MMEKSDAKYNEVRGLVAREVSTASYELKPAWYGEEGQVDFLPPEVTAYVANALIFAFAGGLVATLQPAAKLVGKTVGKWVSDKLQEIIGSKERVKEASDSEVQKTIDELRGAAEKDGLIDKHGDEIQKALSSTMMDSGVTPTRATEIAKTVKNALVKLIS